MAKSALIIQQISSGEYFGVICGNNPQGGTLSKHYTSTQQVQELLEGGEIVTLGKSPNKTIYLHRDEGKFHEMFEASSPYDMAKETGVSEFFLWDEDQVWEHVTQGGVSKMWYSKVVL